MGVIQLPSIILPNEGEKVHPIDLRVCFFVADLQNLEKQGKILLYSYSPFSSLPMGLYNEMKKRLEGEKHLEGKSPLFIVTGASGSGKTFVIPELRKVLPDFEIFDLDWISPFMGDDWQKLRNIWLRVARSIALGGRLTLLCGTMMPRDVEQCVDFSYFSRVYYLNLHCDDGIREMRLRARNWPDDMITEHKTFAKWLLDNADQAYSPPMPTIDTSETERADVAVHIKEWVHRHLSEESFHNAAV